MKKIIFLLSISLLIIISCQEKKSIIDGMYSSNNDQIFYALEFNKKNHSVKIFMQSLYIKKDFKNYIKAKYRQENNRLYLDEIESDLLPSQRNKKIICEIEGNLIKINCQELFKETIGSKSKCLEEKLIFEKR